MSNDQHLIDESQVPDDLASAEVVKTAPPSAFPARPDMPMFFSGSLPPNIQHDTSFVGTKIGSSRIPTHSLMPLGVQGNPATNAGIQSTTTRIVESGAARGIELDTNGSPNPNQQKLNLVQGTNITIFSDPSGAVTIAGAGGDGLVHGDAIWELDPAYFWQRDEFDIFGTNNALTNGAGRLAWTSYVNVFSLNNVSSGQLPPFLSATQCEFTSANTAQSVHGMVLPIQNQFQSGGAQALWPLADYPGWKATFVFTPCQKGQTYSSTLDFATNYAKARLYIGFASAYQDSNGANTTARPFCFAGLRFDTDTTAPSIGDTTFHFECVSNIIQDNTSNVGNNTQGNTFDTGIVPTENVAYRLDMESQVAGQIIFTLSGGGVTVSHTLSVPTYAPSNSQFTLSGITFSGNNNYPTMKWNGGGTFPFRGGSVWGSGSIFSVSGITGTLIGYNGTYTTLLSGISGDANTSMITKDLTNHAAGTVATAGTPTVTGKPAFLPIWILSTNNLSGASTVNLAFRANFYSFVWNKGIINSSQAPDSTQARYW